MSEHTKAAITERDCGCGLGDGCQDDGQVPPAYGACFVDINGDHDPWCDGSDSGSDRA